MRSGEGEDQGEGERGSGSGETEGTWAPRSSAELQKQCGVTRVLTRDARTLMVSMQNILRVGQLIEE